MKVFVVTGGWDYGSDEVLSIWETLDEAQAEKRRVEPFNRWDIVNVEEIEIGKPIDMSQF